MLGILAGLSGCTNLPTRETTQSNMPAPAPPAATCGVVFCADGAGGYGGTSRALQEAIAKEGKPIRIELVPWSHGYGRVAVDHTDQGNIQEQACCLAKQVQGWLAMHPGQPVYLIGHSAGSAVVLEAGCRLPPDSIERIILLAPSVSAKYDLRPALASARGGVDVFTSRRDFWALGIGTRLFGTTDRRWTSAAGRVGFRTLGNSPCDQALYARLHQHPWDCCQSWTGHQGGHYGAYRPGFLHAYVLPLLSACPPAVAAR
jgi:pimeloyl-ACP methyl ester carboxylesterase